MNILIFHQYYLSQGDPGISRFNQFAKYWADQGHKITVIAGTVHVQFLAEQDKKKYSGKFIIREKQTPQIEVIRTYVSPAYNTSFRGRLWAYFTYTLSSLLAGFVCGKQDIIIATSPPLFVAIPGYIISRLKRIPLVFEVRDLWPKFAIDTGVLTNKTFIKLATWLENWIYKKANLINVLTPAFKEYLTKEKGIAEKKIIYIPNGADLDIFQPGSRDNWVRQKHAWGNKFVVIYVGAHGLANNLMQLVLAAEKLQSNKDILFVLVGDGMEKPNLKQVAKEKGLENIQFFDPIPKEQVIDFINAADVGTAILQAHFITTYPNKVFDYMTCAKPIILPIDGACRKLLVDDAAAGIFVAPNNPEEFKEKLLLLYNDSNMAKTLGQNGHAFVQKFFDRKKLAQQYLVELANLVSKKQSV